jgi:hypothetical protein
MGYTHYFNQVANLDEQEWINVCSGFSKIIYTSDVALGEVTMTDSYIAINGQCETFLIYKDIEISPYDKELDGFGFCKTRQYPYDEVVTACLIYLYYEVPNKFDISSDGSWLYWQAGRELYTRAFGVVPQNILEREEHVQVSN